MKLGIGALVLEKWREENQVQGHLELHKQFEPGDLVQNNNKKRLKCSMKSLILYTTNNAKIVKQPGM